MSGELQQDTRVSSPVSKYIEYKGNNGVFQYYDKELGESVPLETPIEFSILAELGSVKGGYMDGDKFIRLGSTFVNDLGQPMTVFVDGAVMAKGLYKDLKADIVAKGGKYHTNLLSIMNDEIVIIQFKGAALSAWLEFRKANRDNNQITITEFEDQKKGSVSYKTPKFVGAPIAAGALDKNLLQSASAFLVSLNQKPDVSEVPEAEKKDPNDEIPTVQLEDEVKIEDVPF